MTKKTLFISRDLEQNQNFVSSLNAHFVEVVGLSLIDFVAINFDFLPDSDWIFFYSQNAVKYFFQNKFFQKNKKISENVKIAALGKKTAEAIKSYGFDTNFVGSGNIENVAKLFLKAAKNKVILFPQATNSRESIEKILDDQIVSKKLCVYSNTPKVDFVIPYCDFLVFTSPMNVVTFNSKYLFLPKQMIFAIGESTQKELQKVTHRDILVSENSDLDSLLHLVLKQLAQ